MLLLLSLLSGLLFGGATFLLLQRHSNRALTGVVLLGYGLSLLLCIIGLAARPTPLSTGTAAATQATTPDVLPQALAIIAIVVGLGLLLSALGLQVRHNQREQRLNLTSRSAQDRRQ